MPVFFAGSGTYRNVELNVGEANYPAVAPKASPTDARNMAKDKSPIQTQPDDHSRELQYQSIDWSYLPNDGSVWYGAVIEENGKRYLFASTSFRQPNNNGNGSRVIVREGNRVNSKWEYGLPRVILSPGPDQYDNANCEHTSITIGDFRKGRETYSYLMTYVGRSHNSGFKPYFAVSNSLTGPWTKVGGLHFSGTNHRMGAKIAAGPREGTIQLFTTNDDSSQVITQIVDVSNLDSPRVVSETSIPIRGVLTRLGAAEMTFRFADFAIDGDRLFMSRTLTDEPAGKRFVLMAKAVGIDSIAFPYDSSDGTIWKRERVLTCGQEIQGKWCGLNRVAKNIRGDLLRDDQGRMEVLVTVQADEKNATTRRIHSILF